MGYRDNKKYFRATKFQPGADAPYIRKMNDFLHARHHWVTLDTPELVPALYAAVDARDLPGMADVDASLLVFCRHIKPHATVALSGECADEIFGGYPWYRDPTVRERYGFPWAQSTAYRASFIKPGVLGGIADTDPKLLEMAKVYRLPLTARLRYIWLPGIFPSFCESCIAAMGMCWKSGVSAEVIGLPDHSVGDALYRAKITLSTPDVFAWTLVIVLLSAALSAAAAALLRAAKTRLCGEVRV